MQAKVLAVLGRITELAGRAVTYDALDTKQDVLVQVSQVIADIERTLVAHQHPLCFWVFQLLGVEVVQQNITG